MNCDGHLATFVFYSKAQGAQACLGFSKDLKHCNVILSDGEDWHIVDFDRTGILIKRLHMENGAAFIQRLTMLKDVSAIISVQVGKRQPVTWFPWWSRACNEVCRYAAGVGIGFSFNPRHLYSKLLKYQDSANYELLSHWRRQDGISGRQQRTKSE